jgi:ribosomal protein L11 methyltransferase
MNLNHQLSDASPYDKLYIYYLNGRLENPPGRLGGNFIGNWEEGDTSFLFFSEPALDQIDVILSRQPQLTLKDQYCMSYDDWHGEPLKCFRAGRFVVTPPWRIEQTAPGEVPILLDPGVVFGVGNHPTTQDCLACIDVLCSNNKIQSTLDLGTGTGVLAIAAAKLGSRCNIAVDNNFLAAKTARNNVAINHLEDRVYVACGKAENSIDSKTDLITANIHYDVMRQLIDSPGFLTKKWFILSGLLRTEARRVEAQLSYHSAVIMDKIVRDGVWHTFFGSIG